MSKDLKTLANLGADLLADEHLDAVVGGTPGYPGLPLVGSSSQLKTDRVIARIAAVAVS